MYGFTYTIEAEFPLVTYENGGAMIALKDCLIVVYGEEVKSENGAGTSTLTWRGQAWGTVVIEAVDGDTDFGMDIKIEAWIEGSKLAKMGITANMEFKQTFGTAELDNHFFISGALQYETGCTEIVATVSVNLHYAPYFQASGIAHIVATCEELYKVVTKRSPPPPAPPLPPPPGLPSPPPNTPPPSPPPALTACDRVANGCPVNSRCGTPDGLNANYNPSSGSGRCCDEVNKPVLVGPQHNSFTWCQTVSPPPPALPPRPPSPPSPPPPDQSQCYPQADCVVGSKVRSDTIHSTTLQFGHST